MPITLTDLEVERIRYALTDRNLPRACMEAIVAATLKLDPERDECDLPAAKNLHKFTTCEPQKDPFPLVLELSMRSWLGVEQSTGKPRLGWAHEVANEMKKISQLRAEQLEKEIDLAVGKRRKPRSEKSLVKSLANRKEV